ncbi:DUF930 domain-containing protein [Roseibium algae]|uniref:DUF930 domain-containing protein n=1 Tax=Roseibium algae TaxID=3123038 RepID=A0ABU8TLW5_9HYPH
MDTSCRPSTTIQTDPGTMRFGLALAILLHLLIAAVLAVTRPPPSRRIEIESLSVDIIRQKRPTGPQVEPEARAGHPQQNQPTSTPPTEQPRESQPPLPDKQVRPQKGMISADQLFASTILNDPVNAAIRIKLNNTSSGERMVQICNTEAMEQVALWNDNYAPDFVVAYATEEITIIGDTVLVDGGAFRSHNSWYRLRYNCAFEPETNDIAAFEFITGDVIPEKLWEDLSLPYD